MAGSMSSISVIRMETLAGLLPFMPLNLPTWKSHSRSAHAKVPDVTEPGKASWTHGYGNQRYIQRAPNNIRWQIQEKESREIVARKRASAPGPHGLPYSVYMSPEGLGSSFLVKADKSLLESRLPSSEDFLPAALISSPCQVFRTRPEALRLFPPCNCGL